MSDRLRRLAAYLGSREGRHDIGVAIAAALAVYEGLHRAGVL